MNKIASVKDKTNYGPGAGGVYKKFTGTGRKISARAGLYCRVSLETEKLCMRCVKKGALIKTGTA